MMTELNIRHLNIEVQDASPAIIFGHADADGHLAAEQTRTNLQAEGVEVDNVIVSLDTRNYRFWEQTLPTFDLSQFRLVVVVDIAFSFRSPADSLKSLLQAVDNFPNTHFIVIDHHSLKQPSKTRTNLTLVEVDSVYDCCLGTPSDELMVVAAICDGDGKSVKSRTTNKFIKRALGVRRAAADVHGMVGQKLLSLICSRQWKFFESLAEEPVEFHKMVRGRRTPNSLNSPLIEAAKKGEI